ncbi:hypothetical protein HBI80_100540 [Parastagonospora nodorum]|nr:hypothetical protein HBH52_040070 [Parastagonospora nodorum]KAH4904888.1 hypothetical protein HBI80_100540 [Parastagonospora nodorum]KAH6470065.1 hypothetical protein HBI59_039380 [Parastagonospora nodorum]
MYNLTDYNHHKKPVSKFELKFYISTTLRTIPADDKSQIKGTTAAAKDAGYASFPAFLIAYGLKMRNDGDVKEGKAILREMGYGV